MPPIDNYIEEIEEEDIETTGGISVQEYNPDMQFRDYEFIDIIKRPEWKELVGLVNEVRDNIPDIPEIKYYDDDLEKISEIIEEVRSQIPVVPEVKYYDDDLNAIKDKFNYEIQQLAENIEVKDFESRVDVDNVKTNLKETS